MSYSIEVSMRQIESLFGTGYPRLVKTLPLHVKSKIIDRIVREKFTGALFSYEIMDGGTKYSFKVGTTRGTKAYNVMSSLEEWVHSIPRLGLFSPPRWWNSLFYTSPRTKRTYCIDEINTSEVFDFLKEHKVHHSQYQLFSKYQDDLSIAFKNDEVATMFTLHYAEKI